MHFEKYFLYSLTWFSYYKLLLLTQDEKFSSDVFLIKIKQTI